MELTLYSLLLFFFIYGFLGWISEVIFAAFKSGKFVNRGFLLGPICPIYGIGVAAVLLACEPMMDRPWLVYIVSGVLTSLIELLIGIISKALLHERLWDYSNMPLNIGGYICLTFSLVWGAACIMIVYGLHPLVAGLVRLVPHTLGIVLICVFSALFLTDLAITLFHALKIERRMTAIDEAARALEALSVKIGGGAAEQALRVREKAQELEKAKEPELERRRTELEQKRRELTERYERLVGRRNIVHEHLFSAFTNLSRGRYSSAYSRIQSAREAMKARKKENKTA